MSHKHMGVALINPPDSHRLDAEEEHAPPPLGLCYIAQFLRDAGHRVDLYDLAEHGSRTIPEPLARRLDSYTMVGFTSYTKTFGAAIDLVRALRRVKPSLLIVFGGPHATPCAQELLERYPEIDFIVRNDGEIPMLRLLEEIQRTPPNYSMVPSLCWRRHRDTRAAVIINDADANPPPLDSLPLPARDFIMEPQRESFETRGRSSPGRTVFLCSTRGCPKRCTFCSIIVMSPKWRFRSARNIMVEIHHLRARQPVEHISFIDANFFVDTRRAVELSDRLYRLDPTITFSGTATADHVVRHPTAIRGIAKNCASLEIGIESGSDSVLLRFGKRTSVRHNYDAISLLTEVGIELNLDFIMYDPWTSLTELRENFEFLRRAELLGYYPADCLLNALKIYPGTAAHDRAVSEFGLHSHHMMELLPPFVHPTVAEVYAAMTEFRCNWQRTVNSTIERLDSLAHTGTCRRTDGCRQSALALLTRLRHAPYKIFEEILTTIEGGGSVTLGETTAFADMVSLLKDAAPKDATHRDLERVK